MDQEEQDNKRATDAVEMEDTMNQIFGPGDSTGTKKNHLLNQISSLEKDIDSAQEVYEQTNVNRSSFSQTLSPEETNERQKKIVFLKKDLESKKTEYDELNIG